MRYCLNYGLVLVLGDLRNVIVERSLFSIVNLSAMSTNAIVLLFSAVWGAVEEDVSFQRCLSLVLRE